METTIKNFKRSAPPVKQQSPQQKFMIARKELSDSLIERSGEVDIVLSALLCQENPLLVGPPGTAKSLLLDSLLRWMDANTSKFSVLLTKFTTPEEVFGPISVKGLKDDQYRRITVGKLPEADVAFVDEIFKASSAILNTMLRILNERVYDNGTGSFAKVPLKICVSASNEWPNDDNGGKELSALFDRFLFRKTVKPIATQAGRQRLLWSFTPPTFSHHITTAEIQTAHTQAMGLVWTDAARTAFETILAEIRKEGIFPGDRRQYKSVSACKAYAYLRGANEVHTEHLEILAHTLWDDPQEQPDKVAKIVARIANPVGMKVNDLLTQVEDVLAKCAPTDAVPKLKAIQKELTSMPYTDRRVQDALNYVAESIKRSYDAVIGIQRDDN